MLRVSYIRNRSSGAALLHQPQLGDVGGLTVATSRIQALRNTAGR
jgi:hypothetical protein